MVRALLRRGYRSVDWEKVKEENEHKNNPNSVYNNLLESKSIIKFFIDRKDETQRLEDGIYLSHYLEGGKEI